jgi:hypothetical protein
VAFVVYDQPPGRGPVRLSEHRSHAAARLRAQQLVEDYLDGGWRLVEQLLGAGRWRRWVFRRGGEWAAVEVREENGAQT